LGIVNNVKYASAGSVGVSYEAFAKASGTSAIAAPLVFRNSSGYESGIQVQNVGAVATNITMRVTATEGSAPKDASNNPVTGPWETTIANVAPGGVATFYLPTDANLSGIHDLFGAASFTSTGGVPIVAVVNTTRYQAGMAMNYIGINH